MDVYDVRKIGIPIRFTFFYYSIIINDDVFKYLKSSICTFFILLISEKTFALFKCRRNAVLVLNK